MLVFSSRLGSKIQSTSESKHNESRAYYNFYFSTFVSVF